MSDDIMRALGNLEGKVDLILERAQAIEEASSKVSDRVSKLEHESTATKTTLAVGGGAIALIAGSIGALADRLFK